jgi:hypothetical protein
MSWGRLIVLAELLAGCESNGLCTLAIRYASPGRRSKFSVFSHRDAAISRDPIRQVGNVMEVALKYFAEFRMFCVRAGVIDTAKSMID